MIRILIVAFLVLPLGLNAQQDMLNRVDPLGRKTGHWVYSGQTGTKQYEGFFSEGHPVGKFLRYHPNGLVSARMDYDSTGTRVDAQLFDTEGILLASGVYLHQRKEGLWEFFSAKKLPVYRIFYQNGLINGDAWRYDAEGHPLEKTSWKFNQLEGIQITFYPSGAVQSNMSYRGGVADGLYEILSPTGITEISGTYSEGLKSGTWTYFKPNGTLDYALSFRRGKVLNPDVLNKRQREAFENFEKNRKLLKDPEDFLNNPEELLRR